MSVLVFQLGNFSPSDLFAVLIFGSVGFGAFIYGEKNVLWRTQVIGVILMAYPYFLSGTLIIYLIGIVLTAEYRYRHISNARIKQPNARITGNLRVCGISYFF